MNKRIKKLLLNLGLFFKNYLFFILLVMFDSLIMSRLKN